MIEFSGNVQCLICNETIAVLEEYNSKRYKEPKKFQISENIQGDCGHKNSP